MFNRFLTAAVLSVGIYSVAPGVVTVVVEDVVLPSPGVSTQGFFDVYVEVTDPVSPQISGFDLVVDLSPASSGIVFDSIASPGTTIGGATHPFVFEDADGAGEDEPFPFGLTDSSVMVSNFLLFSSTPTLPLDDGDGLVRVFFTVDPGTVGVFDLTVDVTQTVFTDDSIPVPMIIPFEVNNGSITVQAQTGGTGVPEPMTCVLGVMGLAVLGATTQRRRP